MNVREIIDTVASLKNLPRTGWVLRGVSQAEAENVAEHSFESASLALVIATKLKEKGVEVNVYKAVTIALIHDWAESLVGDIPLWTTIRLRDKKNMVEEEAFEHFAFAKKLFEEYSEAKTLEGLIARISDVLATYLQACRYIKIGYSDVEEIKTSTYNKIIELTVRNQLLKNIIDEFLK